MKKNNNDKYLSNTNNGNNGNNNNNLSQIWNMLHLHRYLLCACVKWAV